MNRYRLFLCEFVAGIFCLEFLAIDEQIDEENLALCGLFVLEASSKSVFLHVLGIDLIDTDEERWFLP